MANDIRPNEGHDPAVRGERRRGRGAISNASGRYEFSARETVDDGWEGEAELPAFATEVRLERARTIIMTNASPDISFEQSINPYRGCEHGCIYCYARPSHAYLGHSPGLDFETKLYVKPDAARLLADEIGHPRYAVKTIALGTNTDPYQPIERGQRITRGILEVLAKARHPVGIVTKSALVLRDIDLLAPMAADGLVKVALSVTTLDRRLARALEPRASSPARRLDAIERLSAAGIPTAVMVAPIIPGLTDHELEAILSAAQKAGAREAGRVVLRLPLELKTLWREWLDEHAPDRKARILKLVASLHGGRDYDARFGQRQRGSGPYADQIATRYSLATHRLGLNARRQALRTDLFVRPVLAPPAPGGEPKRAGGQLDLF